MNHDLQRLQDYIDGLLPAHECDQVETHLQHCPECRQWLAAMRQQESQLAAVLSNLEPAHTPSPQTALQQFRQKQKPSLWTRMYRSVTHMNKSMSAPRLRWATTSLAIAAVVLVFAAFPAARQAAAQFLGIFRAEQFTVVQLNDEQIERLQDIGEQVDAGLLGSEQTLREAEQPYTVASIEEASQLAGFELRVPTELPEGLALQEISAARGPAKRLEVDRDTLLALLSAAGVDDVQLPDVDRLFMEADFPLMVAQAYAVDETEVTLVEMQSPQASYSPEVDPNYMGELMLRLLGMPAEEAQHFSQTVDWTNTLVIPLPAQAARYREIEIDGVSGLMVLPRDSYDSGEELPSAILMWEKDGIVYGLTGYNIRDAALVDFANHLR